MSKQKNILSSEGGTMADDVSIPAAKRQKTVNSVSRDELWNSPREELISRILKQQQEIETLQSKQAPPDQTLDELRETVEKLKMQVTESARQESILVIRLANKEQEVQELMAQIQEAKAQNPSSAQLQALLLDPAINLMFQHMKQEMDLLKNKLDQAQKDLAAWKFTPDSQTGKRLMAKCRMLLQENEELGKTVSSGKMAKLEGDIALQKKLIVEMKKSETETEEFLADMDEDMEAMQGTVYLLQQELKETKDRLQKYEQQDNSVNNKQPEQQDTSLYKQQDTRLNMQEDNSLSVSDLCREVTTLSSSGLKTIAQVKIERTDVESMDHGVESMDHDDGFSVAANNAKHVQGLIKQTDVTNGKAYANQVSKNAVGDTRQQQLSGKFVSCKEPVTNHRLENEGEDSIGSSQLSDTADEIKVKTADEIKVKDTIDSFRTALNTKIEVEPSMNGIIGQIKVEFQSSSDVSD